MGEKKERKKRSGKQHLPFQRLQGGQLNTRIWGLENLFGWIALVCCFVVFVLFDS